ncbi:MAG: MBL fold metallo-hydrolase [Anaerolineales bacterium]
MEITWFGHSCFRLTERNVATIVTDPFDKSIGLAIPRLRADIVTISHDAPGHNNLDAVRSARPVVGPGEYEIGGVFITGVPTRQNPKDGANGKSRSGPALKNTIYVFDFDGLTVCHLGDLDHVPSQSRVEALGTVDVLLVPIGGGNGLNASQAAEMISLIEPAVVVPMHFKTANVKLKLDSPNKFLKEMGLAKSTPEDNLKVTKSSLPDETQVVVLKPKGG